VPRCRRAGHRRVPEILGRPALTFAEWARDHAADFANRMNHVSQPRNPRLRRLRGADLRGSDDRRLRDEDGVRNDGRLIEGQVVG